VPFCYGCFESANFCHECNCIFRHQHYILSFTLLTCLICLRLCVCPCLCICMCVSCLYVLASVCLWRFVSLVSGCRLGHRELPCAGLHQGQTGQAAAGCRQAAGGRERHETLGHQLGGQYFGRCARIKMLIVYAGAQRDGSSRVRVPSRWLVP
jgi:hypothetical protein